MLENNVFQSVRSIERESKMKGDITSGGHKAKEEVVINNELK
jgi:hypothetical protein